MAVPGLRLAAVRAESPGYSPRSPTPRSAWGTPLDLVPLLRAPLKRYAAPYTAGPEDVAKVTAVFTKYDRDGSGWISVADTPLLMRDLALPMSEETFARYLAHFFEGVESYVAMPREGLAQLQVHKSPRMDNKHPSEFVKRGAAVTGTNLKGKWLQLRGAQLQDSELFLPFEIDGERVLVERGWEMGVCFAEFLALYQVIIAQQPPAVRKLTDRTQRVTASDRQRQEHGLRSVFEHYVGDAAGVVAAQHIPDCLEELGFPDVNGDGHAAFVEHSIRTAQVSFPQFAACCNMLVEHAAGAAPALAETRRHGPSGFSTPRRQRTPRS